MAFKTHLITLYGKTGKKYCLSFECEDSVDADMMIRDCDLQGEVNGRKIGETLWEDMPDERIVN